MSIQNTVLGQTTANIFVGSGTLGSAISTMYFCNRTATATSFNLYVVGAGFTANANNIAYSNKTVAANDTYIMDLEKLFLGPNDTLQAVANTGNAIVATISSIGL